MKNYGPTSLPGDTRDRVWHTVIDTPMDERTDAQKSDGVAAPVPQTIYFEESGVKLGDHEKVLEKSHSENRIPFDPSVVIPLRHPVTDELTGETATAGEAMALIYSYIRMDQEARQAAEEAE
eukprot:GHVR01162614.1.p3 GENE.GHVR01162614.1~~GHVR01162614.1.p3  ORF type:complete len:122 (-),score=24.03 GHVR01162614.1:1943-2308(-)